MVSSYGDSHAMCVRIVGEHFINHLCIGDFLSPIYRDAIISNNFKCFRPPDALVARYISSFDYPLAQSSQFVVVLCIPDLLVLRIFPQLSVFKLL